MTDPKTSQRSLIGCWLQTPSPWVCEILAAVGFDAVFIDGEHGVLTHQTIDPLVALAKAVELQVFYRVAAPDRPHIQQALDSGADGLVLPQIKNLKHASEAAAFAKYPPVGTRGMGFPRSLNYGDTPDDFIEEENARTKCFVMVETPGALEQAKEIAALPAVDGLFMGPYDLSLTRGRGQYKATHADYSDAKSIAIAANSANKLLGLPAFSDDDFNFARSHRAYVVTVADDLSVLVDGFKAKLRSSSAKLADS